MSMKVRVKNKMNTLARKVEVGAVNVLAAGAALLQREVMMAAMAMSIWDTGNLINSHTRRKISDTTWEVVSPAEYSIYVHQGATYGSAAADGISGARSLRGRPWFTQGVAAAEPKIFTMLDRAMRSGV